MQRQKIMNSGWICGGLMALTASLFTETGYAEEQRSAAYREIAIAFADEMLTHGTDRYGWASSPQFATMLMRGQPPSLPPDPVFLTKPKRGQSPSMVVNLPNIYKGGNRAHKITYRGGDVADDAGLYQLLYAMSEASQNGKYRKAADASIQWFLLNAPMRNGTLPWGEHSGWDFRREHFDYGYPYDKKHEFDSRWPLWETFQELQPQAGADSLTVLERFAKALWVGGVGRLDGKLVYCRHVSMVEFERPNHGEWAQYGMFPRHGGYYLTVWSIALASSDNAAFRDWIAPRIGEFLAALAEQTVEHRHPIYHFRGEEDPLNPGQVASMATDLIALSDRLRPSYASLASEAFRLAGLSQDTLMQLKAELSPEEAYRLWKANAGTKEGAERAEYFHARFIASADALAELRELPERDIKGKVAGQTQDGRIPEQYAETIDALLWAAESGAGQGATFYLRHADRFADEAARMFLDGHSPLPKSLDREPKLLDGTPFPTFYHSYLGGDDLMWSFWRLAAALEAADSTL